MLIIQENENVKKPKNEPHKQLTNKQLWFANMAGARPEDYIYGFSTKDDLKMWMNQVEQSLKEWKQMRGENDLPADGKQ